VYHVELSQHPRVARKFNLSIEELQSLIVRPWVKGESIELGEYQYVPERASLLIYEGRELRVDELSMGRGWQNAVRLGEDVTKRILTDAGAAGSPPKSATERFKDAVLSQCGSGRIGIHQVVWLANSEYPGVRVSERLALAEQAIWELLHQRRLQLLTSAGIVPDSEWEATLLSWETWADPRAPSTLLEATGR
jgi:hypothetical protein